MEERDIAQSSFFAISFGHLGVFQSVVGLWSIDLEELWAILSSSLHSFCNPSCVRTEDLLLVLWDAVQRSLVSLLSPYHSSQPFLDSPLFIRCNSHCLLLSLSQPAHEITPTSSYSVMLLFSVMDLNFFNPFQTFFLGLRNKRLISQQPF